MARLKYIPDQAANGNFDGIPVYRVPRQVRRKLVAKAVRGAGAHWKRGGMRAVCATLMSGLVLSCTLAQNRLPFHPTVEVCSIRAREENGSTLVAITLHGHAKARIAGDGTHLVLLMTDTAAAEQLGANVTSGGLVTRFSLDGATPANAEARLQMELSAPARAELAEARDPQTLLLRLTPLDKVPPISVRDTGAGLYDVDAFQADAASLLKSVAQSGHTGVVLIGTVSSRVTVELRQVNAATAIEMLAKAAGLSTRMEGKCYVVGSRKELDAAYPAPTPEPPRAVPVVMKQDLYHCNYIHAAELVTTLEKMFPKETLHAAVGGAPLSPRLEAASTSDVTGVQGNKTDAGASAGTDASTSAREVVLWGEEATVTQAMTLARRLDVRRAQVKISVTIADVSLTALRQLGVTWSWSDFTFQELSTSDINFGRFTHSPVNVTATLAALEKNDQAKVLAAPSMTVLDGERGYVLIGDRLLFPKLIGYTQASTPIFDKEEVRVGIYLQVAAQIGANGDMTLTIYPQVSTVTGFLNVPNMGSYPQISTREQKTTIRVKDGEKIVVGGLIRDEDIKNVQRVPVLSRIPLFGELFTYRSHTHNKSDVIITITPEIIKD